jgi:hypothetical protein
MSYIYFNAKMVFTSLMVLRMNIQLCCPFGRVSANGYMQPEILLALSIYGQDFNAFLDLNNC